MDRQDITITVPWMRRGTELVAAAVADLPDAAFTEPSALPGWSRAHVIAHLARNAEALGRLVHWAATGEVTPMYPDQATRAADIESTAQQSAAELRADLARTAAALDAGLLGLDDQGWHARVRSALGRELPALDIPWMRIREVWLHGIDLRAGVGFDAFPPDLVDLLLDDVTAVVGAKPDCPPVLLHPEDRDRTWVLGEGAGAGCVGGPAADLLAWVTGRAGDGLPRATGPLPKLPAWL